MFTTKSKRCVLLCAVATFVLSFALMLGGASSNARAEVAQAVQGDESVQEVGTTDASLHNIADLTELPTTPLPEEEGFTLEDAGESPQVLTAQSENTVESLRAYILWVVTNRVDLGNEDYFDVSDWHIDVDTFKVLYDDVISSQPELFDVRPYARVWRWTSGSLAGQTAGFVPQYKLDASISRVRTMRAAVQEGISDLMSWVPANGRTLDKVRAVHDWICWNVRYDRERYYAGTLEWHDYSMYGALVNRVAVCSGYAESFQIAMDLLGIPCTTVSAHDHAWNRVKVDGSWYHVDTTWDENWTPDDIDSTSDICTIWFMRSDEGIRQQDITYSSHYANGGEITHADYDDGTEVPGTDTRYDNTDWGEAGWQAFGAPLSQNMGVTSLSLSSVTLELGTWCEADLSVSSMEPSAANARMAVWSSSDPSVAYVSASGHLATFKTLGNATISCKVGKVTKTCRLTVGELKDPDLSKDGWVTLASGKKGYAKGGALVTGWLTLDGQKYWFSSSGEAASGWKTVSGQTYYFRPGDYRMATGFATIGGQKTLFRSDGRRAEGWVTLGGANYYADTGIPRSGWQDIDGTRYYFREDGDYRMAQGFATIGGQKVLFRADGRLADGWVTLNGYKYYADAGVPRTGKQTIGGKTYTFYSDGRLKA